MNKSIPTIVIEEHNEAFFVWHDAILNKTLPPKNTCLIHFDSHADIDLPNLSISLHKEAMTLKDIYDLTYNELDLQNFITPCIYQEMFNEVYWFQPDLCKKKKGILHVWSHRNQGKQLFMSMSDKGFPGTKKCPFFWKNTSDSFESSSSSTILDIDIDFFLCEDEPVPLMIEITRDEFDRYETNRLHPLRFSMGNSIKPVKKDGKFYYILELMDDPGIGGARVNNIDDNNIVIFNREHSLEEAFKKVQEMTFFLKKNNLRPELINICRSHYSGYTPRNFSDQIQKMVIKSLESLFKLKIQHIDDLLKDKGF